MNALDESTSCSCRCAPTRSSWSSTCRTIYGSSCPILVLERAGDVTKVTERILRSDYWKELNRVDYRRRAQ